jgi:hypothetical protein
MHVRLSASLENLTARVRWDHAVMTMIARDGDADDDIANAARIGVNYLPEANDLLREIHAIRHIPENAPNRESEVHHVG